MYLPQYSKVDFINTDIGFNHYRPMIGSRILVYNPGDLPIDWELKIDENKRGFWSCRGGPKFRVRRFNVQRLLIPNAVDWCGLETYSPLDNAPYKYGDRYFRRRVFDLDKLISNINDNKDVIESIQKPNAESNYTVEEVINALRQGHMIADKNWLPIEEGEPFYTSMDKNGNVRTEEIHYPYEDWNTTKNEYKENRVNLNAALQVAFNLHLNELDKIWDGVMKYEYLNEAHPHFCYYVEPVPRQRLAHYIKLFYWQTIQWRGNKTRDGKWAGLDQWKEMMPADFWVDSSAKDQIANPKHPLVNFIRMFWQIDNKGKLIKPINDIRSLLEDLDFEYGIALANRYQELYDLCITDEERYELYWDTLKKLLSEFQPMISFVEEYENETKNGNYIHSRNGRKNEYGESQAYGLTDFIYDFINKPLEFINTDTRDLDYDQVVFNAFKNPEWITDDYMEIDSSLLTGVDIIKEYLLAIEEDPDAIFNGKIINYDRDRLIELGGHSALIKKLDKSLGDGGCLNDLLDDYYYLNSESRMLYSTPNPYGMEFVYKPTKLIQNNAIHKGKWFKLPPGWSLLDIEPVVDESIWGGKRWKESRLFDWGYSGDLYRNPKEVQQLYDFINDKAREEFFNNYRTAKEIGWKSIGIIPNKNINEGNNSVWDDKQYGTEDDKDELIKFKVWYEDQLEHFPIDKNYFAHNVYKKMQSDAEYFFLKTINGMWQLIAPYYSWTALKGVYFNPDTGLPPTNDDYDVSGLPLQCINGAISDWWWYAQNYLWANFPPIYWAMADMLNNLIIKYVPLFY